MIGPDETASETAIGYTDDFFDAAVKKIDKLFGKGFAKENPALMQAYVQACAMNLSGFMQSAVALQAAGGFDDLLDGLD